MGQQLCSTRLRSAFLGGGVNSAVGRAHAAALALDNHWQLVGGRFSRDESINSLSIKEYNIQPPLSPLSFDELIQGKDRYDLIHVLTPPSSHSGMISSLLAEGISVVSEKPLVTSSADALALKAVIEKTEGFLAVIYNYLGYPMVREIRQQVLSGKIGQVHEIHVSMPQEGFIKVDDRGSPILPQPWRQEDGAVATVSLDLGVHVHMMIYYLTGCKPKSVFAQARCNGHVDVIDSVNAITTYDSGIISNVWYGKSYLGNRNGLEVRIFGEKGAFYWMQNRPEVVNASSQDGTRYELDRASLGTMVANSRRYERFKVGHPGGYVEALANYYEDVRRSFLFHTKATDHGSDDCFGVQESIDGLLWLEAIHRSAETGCLEKVECNEA